MRGKKTLAALASWTHCSSTASAPAVSAHSSLRGWECKARVQPETQRRFRLLSSEPDERTFRRGARRSVASGGELSAARPAWCLLHRSRDAPGCSRRPTKRAHTGERRDCSRGSQASPHSASRVGRHEPHPQPFSSRHICPTLRQKQKRAAQIRVDNERPSRERRSGGSGLRGTRCTVRRAAWSKLKEAGQLERSARGLSDETLHQPGKVTRTCSFVVRRPERRGGQQAAISVPSELTARAAELVRAACRMPNFDDEARGSLQLGGRAQGRGRVDWCLTAEGLWPWYRGGLGMHSCAGREQIRVEGLAEVSMPTRPARQVEVAPSSSLLPSPRLLSLRSARPSP